jgi:hypothetical protein
MKVRIGFVSNSSSCSFCIYGMYIDDEKLIDKIENDDAFNELLHSENIKIFGGMDFVEGVWAGKSLTSIRDDQTFGDFKKEIEASLIKLFDKDATGFGIAEEAWMNT